jgi:hypothetical protein
MESKDLESLSKEIQRYQAQTDARIVILEERYRGMSQRMEDLVSETKETHRILLSLTQGLGTDPDTNMPNTLCGLFVRVNSNLERIQERDKKQESEVGELSKSVAELSRVVKSRYEFLTWLRNHITQASIASLALAGTIWSVSYPIWHKNQIIAPTEKPEKVGNPKD